MIKSILREEFQFLVFFLGCVRSCRGNTHTVTSRVIPVRSGDILKCRKMGQGRMEGKDMQRKGPERKR